MAHSSFLFPYDEMEQLAQHCASPDARAGDSDLTRFRSLQNEARRCAKAVAHTGKLQHQAAWEALLPVLDNMQKLLSQRGVNHKDAGAELPEWRSWWDSFSGTNHLKIPFRTVQYRLNRYRGEPGGYKQHRQRVTYREQLQLARTASAGHRLAAVCKTGMGSVSEARIFYCESLPLEMVDEIIERLSSTAPRIAPSNQTDLGQAIILAAGARIRECMKGLTSQETTDVLQIAFARIIDKFCQGSGICVKVECSPPAPQVGTGPITMRLGRDAA